MAVHEVYESCDFEILIFFSYPFLFRPFLLLLRLSALIFMISPSCKFMFFNIYVILSKFLLFHLNFSNLQMS